MHEAVGPCRLLRRSSIERVMGLAIYNLLITLIISKGFYYWQRKHQ